MQIKLGAITQTPPRTIFLIILVSLEIILAIILLLPNGVDWTLTFRPAALVLANGQSPYNSPKVLAPYAGAPWGLLPLLPLALLPESAGRAVLFFISLGSFAYTAVRLGAKRLALVAFLLSPPVMHCLLNANLDWMPLLGFILPPQIGLFFLAVKPQVGIAVAFFWLVEAWRTGGIRSVARVFGPVGVVLLVSFLFYGLWPMNVIKVSEHTTFWNYSFWPASLPVGIALTIAALRSRNAKFALAASPCFSPHVLLHSWSGVLIAFVNREPELLGAVIGFWTFLIGRAILAGM